MPTSDEVNPFAKQPETYGTLTKRHEEESSDEVCTNSNRLASEEFEELLDIFYVIIGIFVGFREYKSVYTRAIHHIGIWLSVVLFVWFRLW